MKIAATVLCALATGASAFSPQKGFVSRNSGLIVPDQQDVQSSPLVAPNMVAGGAERSYGQEYYEGALFSFQMQIAADGRRLKCWVQPANPLMFYRISGSTFQTSGCSSKPDLHLWLSFMSMLHMRCEVGFSLFLPFSLFHFM